VPYRLFTAGSCIWELEGRARHGELLDLASLDHDLSGGAYEPSDHRSGYAVARYIALMPPELRPRKIILHSRNDKGVANMAASLPMAQRVEFGTPEYWLAVKEAMK